MGTQVLGVNNLSVRDYRLQQGQPGFVLNVACKISFNLRPQSMHFKVFSYLLKSERY